MIGPDALPVALRALAYVGSIGAAGGVFYIVSFPRAAIAIRSDVELQIAVGCGLLLLVEPLRYVTLQLSIAGGDWSLAFGPDLRWMGMQTPMGQAAVTRGIAALALLTLGSRRAVKGSFAAIVMVASFALEGHTASSEARTAGGTTALLIHVVAVHWLLGALYPLLVLTAEAQPTTLADTVETFGRRAVWIVVGLLAAGVMLLVFLTGGRLNIESSYQQRFVLKLALVVGLLATATWNKLRLTPLLSRDHEAGRERLGASIKVEMLVALLILLATAWAINSSPDG